MTGRHEESDGDDVPLGMPWSESDSWNVNLSNMYSDTLTVNTCVGYLRSVYESGAGTTNDPGNPQNTVFWTSNSNENTHFAGVGLNWAVIEDVVDVRFDYSYSDSRMENVQANDNTGGITTAPLYDCMPANSVRRNDLKLGVDWYDSRQTTFGLDYQFTNMRARSWGWDPMAYLGSGAGGAFVTNEIGMGYEEPDYDAHYLMMSVKYNFK